MVEVLLVAAGIAYALPPAPLMKVDFPAYQVPVNILCWPSGLQVVAVRQGSDRHVAISMVVEGGDSAELADARGAAHLLEHLWFRSVPPGGTTSVWDAASGLDITASTRVDSTVFTTIGAAEDLPALLALEAQRLLDPLAGVTAAVVASEREVVKREFLQRGGETTEVGRRLLESVLYPTTHPYHGVPLTAATIDALSLEDVKAYAAASYRPSKTTIRIEGAVPVDTRALAELVEGAFPDRLVAGTGASCLHPMKPDVPDRPVTSEVVVAEAPIWYQRLYVGWVLPPGHDAGVGVMDEVAAFVGSSLRVRLLWVPGLKGNQEGRGDAACAVIPGKVASELICALDVPEGIAPDAITRVAREAVTSLWSDATEFEEAMFWRAPDFWVGAMSEATSVGLQASEHRALWSHFGDEHDLFGAYGEGGLVHGSDIVAFGRKWVTPERMGLALLRPTPASADRPAAATTWKPRLEAAPATRWTPVQADVDRLAATKLERGLWVWTAPQTRDEPAFARTELSFRGGWLDTPEPGLQEAMAATATWPMPIDPAELEEATATLWWTYFADRSAGAISAGSAGNLDAQLWRSIAFLQFRLDSTLRQDVLDSQADVFRDEAHSLDYILAEPWLFADARRRGHLFGLLPGALPWWERNHAARSARIPQVTAWQAALFRPDNAVLVVAGAVDPATAVAQADKYLGKWKGLGGDPLPPPAAPGPVPEGRLEVLPVVRSLTQVAVSCRVPGYGPGTDAPLSVLELVLARGMWQTFREDGRTYTPSAWVEAVRPETALLTLEVDVLPGEGAAAARALTGLLDLVSKGPPEPVVTAAKKDAATSFALDLADAAGSVGRLTWTWETGGTLDDVKAWPGRLEAVDAAAVAALLSDCVGHEAVTVIGSDDPDSLGAVGLPVEVHEPRELASYLTERMD